MVQDRRGRTYAKYFEHMRVTTFAEKRISTLPCTIIRGNYDYDIISLEAKLKK